MSFYAPIALLVFALCSAALGMSRSDLSTSAHNVRLSFSPYEDTFSAFKKEHGRKYKNDLEEAYRYSVFTKNVQNIEEHNKKFSSGKSTFFMNINHFSDMTHDEYLRYNHLGKYSKVKQIDDLSCSQYEPTQSNPDAIDWRDMGAVTPVKDQGQCGSCYAFSVTGSIEGQNFVQYQTLLSFSEQQIVDCCTDCNGCTSGSPLVALAYIQNAGGLETEDDYPYIANESNCNFQQSNVNIQVTGCSDIPTGDEDALKDAVGNVGPISVAIDATLASFKDYSGGIYDDPNCSSTNLDHAVLAVGYGTSDGDDYWLVKNSWSENWGTEGYVQIKRNSDNLCGIATSARYPFVSK